MDVIKVRNIILELKANSLLDNSVDDIFKQFCALIKNRHVLTSDLVYSIFNNNFNDDADTDDTDDDDDDTIDEETFNLITDYIVVKIKITELYKFGLRLALRYSKRLRKYVVSFYNIIDLQTTPDIIMCHSSINQMTLTELLKFKHYQQFYIPWHSY